jgi:hypothetical protein
MIFGTPWQCIKQKKMSNLLIIKYQMSFQKGLKFQNIVEFREYLSQEEKEITDYLRDIVLRTLPATCKEKLSYNVPFYSGRRRICFIWPGSVPWGGFRKGVMLGFCQGNKLKDPNFYLTHGSNKQVYYIIYNTLEEIDEDIVVSLLEDALLTDTTFK